MARFCLATCRVYQNIVSSTDGTKQVDSTTLQSSKMYYHMQRVKCIDVLPCHEWCFANSYPSSSCTYCVRCGCHILASNWMKWKWAPWHPTLPGTFGWISTHSCHSVYMAIRTNRNDQNLQMTVANSFETKWHIAQKMCVWPRRPWFKIKRLIVGVFFAWQRSTALAPATSLRCEPLIGFLATADD